MLLRYNKGYVKCFYFCPVISFARVGRDSKVTRQCVLVCASVYQCVSVGHTLHLLLSSKGSEDEADGVWPQECFVSVYVCRISFSVSVRCTYTWVSSVQEEEQNLTSCCDKDVFYVPLQEVNTLLEARTEHCAPKCQGESLKGTT